MASFFARRDWLIVFAIVVGELLLPGASSVVCAQPTESAAARQPEAPLFRAPHVGMDAGISLWTTTGIWGRTPEARLGLIALRVQHPLGVPARNAPLRVHYVATLTPTLLLSIPASAIPPRKRTETPPDGLPDFRGTGVGIAPVGLQVNYRLHRAVQPYLRMTTGVAYFFSAVPDVRGKHLNFTLEIGAGVQSALTDRILLTLGYRYHHLSNGFRGDINPGVDSHLLHVGLARTW